MPIGTNAKVSYHTQDELPEIPAVVFVNDDEDQTGSVRLVYSRSATGSEIAESMNCIAEDWRRRLKENPVLRIVSRTAAATVAPLTGLAAWAAHFAHTMQPVAFL